MIKVLFTVFLVLSFWGCGTNQPTAQEILQKDKLEKIEAEKRCFNLQRKNWKDKNEYS